MDREALERRRFRSKGLNALNGLNGLLNGKLFDIEAVFSAIPELLRFLPVSLEITFISMLAGLVLGLVLAIIRIKKVPVLSQLITLFISFIRGTPMIIQLYLSYNGIPLLLKYINMTYGTDYSINAIPAMLFVLITFSCNEAAYNSETIRAALQSVNKGQIEAAESLGMTYFQVLKRVIIPEALVVAVPPLGNALISLLKGTSLAFVAGVVEMTAQGKIISGSTFRFFEVYLALAIIYWALTIVIEQILKYLEKKFSIPDVDGNPLKKRRLFSFFSSTRGDV
ncbi:amino acid ABC transporter permease [Paenibacillus sp. 598K]|uniref:amino acid ABC transporter permease n=1 Tax=Paenibacillus sp. 598K TaxID=1117987 RepID=UPI00162975F2|nr:amino acid ABC transporter permease [Paenibacillus sp. 598K]